METINARFCVLTNCEVLKTLNDSYLIKDTKKKPGLRNLATITYETIQYLSEETSPAKYQSRETIEAFLREIQPFKLSAQECLNIVNNPPTSALHIQLLIEDSEERLTEEQVNQVIEIVRTHIGPPVADDGEGEYDEAGGDNAGTAAGV